MCSEATLRCEWGLDWKDVHGLFGLVQETFFKILTVTNNTKISVIFSSVLRDRMTDQCSEQTNESARHQIMPSR